MGRDDIPAKLAFRLYRTVLASFFSCYSLASLINHTYAALNATRSCMVAFLLAFSLEVAALCASETYPSAPASDCNSC